MKTNKSLKREIEDYFLGHNWFHLKILGLKICNAFWSQCEEAVRTMGLELRRDKREDS